MASTEAPPADGWVYGTEWSVEATNRTEYLSRGLRLSDEQRKAAERVNDEAREYALEKLWRSPAADPKGTPTLVGRDYALTVKFPALALVTPLGEYVGWECWQGGTLISGRGRIVQHCGHVARDAPPWDEIVIAVEGEPTTRPHAGLAEYPVRVRPLYPEEQP